MTPPNYYLDSNNVLYGPIERMPPDKIAGQFDWLKYQKDYDSFLSYLQTLPSHPHTFTGPSRVVGEGEIRWEYQIWDRRWQTCSQEDYEKETPNMRRRVATPKHLLAKSKTKADIFEDAIREFGVDAALEYFATPEDKRHHFDSLRTTPKIIGEKCICDTAEQAENCTRNCNHGAFNEPATQAPGYTSGSGGEVGSVENPDADKQWYKYYASQLQGEGKESFVNTASAYLIGALAYEEGQKSMSTEPLTAQPDEEDEESLLDIAKSMYESAKKLLEQLKNG